MKIKNRLLLIVVLPLVCLAGLTINNVVSSFHDRQQAHQAFVGVEQATILGDLVHALQRERGTSAGFISSGGRSFSGQMNSHRRDVDQAITHYNEISEKLERVSQQNAATVSSRLSQLYNTRSQISNRSLSVGEAARFYTSTINALIEIAARATNIDSHGSIADRRQAYLAIMRAKESAGLERAAGTNGFVAGRFSPAVYKRFSDVAAAQNVLLLEARRAATGERRPGAIQL